MIRFNSVVRTCTKSACTQQALQESDTCGFCGVAAGVGGCKTWVHVHPKGKKAPSVFSTCTFAPRGDERNASVTLSLKTASKGSKHSPCTNVPLKCLFCQDDRWVWKYSMAHHVRTEHAVAVAVRSTDAVALAFRAKYDVSESENTAVKERMQSIRSRKRPKKGTSVTIRPRKRSGGRGGRGTRQQASGVSIDIDESDEEEEEEEEDEDDEEGDEEEGDGEEEEGVDEEEDGEDEDDEDEEGVDEEEEDEQVDDQEEKEEENIEAEEEEEEEQEEEEEEEEEREEENNEEGRRGVDGVGKKNCGRGGRGVGAATPYAVSRTGRRCTTKRQWSQLG